MEDAKVARVEAGRLECENGRSLGFDVAIWTTGPAAAEWLAGTGLELQDGFLAVDAALRCVDERAIFAAGDVATMLPSPRPKAGVFAVRQGPPLADNLRRAAAGQPLRGFEPQGQFLSLIGTGDPYAVAARGRWKLEGRWLWWLKRWIDRRWVRSYSNLD